MRKLYLLLLLFTTFTGFAFSPPVIQNPTPLEICDENNDGFATFDLTVKIPEVLGALDAGLYTVTFYETLNGAQNAWDSISTLYSNISPAPQTIYIRVQENSSGEFSITSLDLVLNPIPTPMQPMDLLVEDIPFDGVAIFDLTVNHNLLLNGSVSNVVTYYHDHIDAEAAVNAIFPANAYTGTNGEVIWARVEGTNGCFSIKSFRLFVTNPDIVFIPDPGFKEYLVTSNPVIDTNFDGEIQFSEALAVNSIMIPPNVFDISSLEGINSFSNLINLNFSHNSVSSINISNLTSLVQLFCDDNQLTSLDVSNSPNLVNIQCSENQLNSLNITGLTNLVFISCYLNSLTSLDVAGMGSLQSLDCRNNQIASLDLSGLTNLQTLNCNANLLTSLSIPDSPNLVELACVANNFTSIDFTPYPNLAYLACGNSGLSAIDVSTLDNLSTFYFYGSQQTTLDISNLVNLVNFQCHNSALISLDLSNATNLSYAYINNNPNLDILNVKNGIPILVGVGDGFFLQNCPSLDFICVDDVNINFFNILISNAANNINPSAVINSYCSFTPGGDYNTITGVARFDFDNNGCTASDITPPFVKVIINDGSVTGSTFTTNDSSYTFYTGAGNFTVTPELENPSFFTIDSPAMVNFPLVDNSISNSDFCITANGVHPDLEIVIAPIVPARPGFDAVYKIVIKNKGNQVQSQVNGIGLSYDAAKLDFLFADQIPSSVGSGTLNWDFANLSPFESKSINMTMHVHGPMDASPVNIGDILVFNTTVDPIAGDESPADNTFQFDQIVVGSFDPNEIICLEGNIVSPIEIGNYLHYIINFENTGTAPAENIVVRDVIDTTQFDVSSLQLMGSSASVTARVTGNIAEFIFSGINLHSGGHGNILLKIRSDNTLVSGDTVSSRANIYFDYNFPVETDPENTVFQSLNNPDVPLDESISVYPNPTRGNVAINCNNNIKSVQLFDVQGRILQTNLVNENQTTIDVSSQANGVYFLKIISDKGMMVKKIVRE
jgi:uncharacterized repeat protein (TIGR01451 family)